MIPESSLPGCRAILLLAASLIPALHHPLPSAAAEVQRDRLVVGLTGASTLRSERHFRPTAAYLASRLADFGYRDGLVVPADPETLGALLRSGKIDVVVDSPYPVMLLKRDAGARVILRGERRGLPLSHSRIFVRRDSGISELEGLRGKSIAFGHRGSTFEFFLPALTLARSGLSPVAIPSPLSAVPPGTVGFTFAGEALNVATWVFYGKTAAGAIDSAAWLDRGGIPDAYMREFEVVGESPELPLFLVALRPGLGGEIAARIEEELRAMHENGDGRRALDAVGIDRFRDLAPGFLGPAEALFGFFPGRTGFQP